MVSQRAKERLWELIEESRGASREAVGYLGGNAVSLLRMLGETLAESDLHDALLLGADLRGCDLSGANLTGSELDDADLRLARFGPDASTSAKLGSAQWALLIVGRPSMVAIAGRSVKRLRRDSGEGRATTISKGVADVIMSLDCTDGRATLGSPRTGLRFLAVTVNAKGWRLWDQAKHALLNEPGVDRVAMTESEVQEVLDSEPQAFGAEVIKSLLGYTD
jgi:hypothetical protein